MIKTAIKNIGFILLNLGSSLLIKYFDIDGDCSIEQEEINQRVSENTQKLVNYLKSKKKKK